MKLTYIEKFGDFLLNLKIVERASERSDKIIKIKDLSETINIHLFKLYLFQDSQDRNHWKSEVEGWLFKISNLSWGDRNQTFESNDYLKWIFNTFYHDKNGDLNNSKLIKIEKTLLKQYSTENIIKSKSIIEFKNISESFLSKVSIILENYNDTQVEELLDEYFDL